MSNARRVLVVEDTTAMRESLCRIVQRQGWNYDQAVDGETALDVLRKKDIDVMVVDLRMPGMSGLEVLRAGRIVSPGTQVIIITAFGTIENAVEAMKLGALDFIVKPFKRSTIVRAVGKALQRRGTLGGINEEEEIIGTTQAIREALTAVRVVAPTSATVLIVGESGTGKELIANAIQKSSARKDGPFVKVNCAALPVTLLESELFGHEKGSFTGAVSQRKGRFELADGGTIFLDEVGQFMPSTQAKLLRILQSGEFERVGGVRTLSVDVRVIAATNVDLDAALKNGSFREDLFYRLNVVRINMPPLRERPEDIPLLAEYFLRKCNLKESKNVTSICPETIEVLKRYSWPGNVRELENAIERAIVFSDGDCIQLWDLPHELAGSEGRIPRGVSVKIGTSVKEAERKLIEQTLNRTNGDKRAAANLLGISLRTLYRKLEDNNRK